MMKKNDSVWDTGWNKYDQLGGGTVRDDKQQTNRSELVEVID